MSNVIEITIRNKVARIASSPYIVGKNNDYIVRFDFDEDWDKYDIKTARFSQDGEYQDIIFTGNDCAMPALDGGKVVEVGAYAGDISTTTPAYLKVQKSIIDDNGVPADPQPDVYAQLMERLNDLEAPAAVLYTEQNLTDEQKAQARDNIGVTTSGSDADISLGISEATVGQVPVVKTVDENGVPTEWEAVELPGETYIVNITYDDSGNIIADKTFSEIKAAHDDGKVVIVKEDNQYLFYLEECSDSEAIFSVTYISGVTPGIDQIQCTIENVWSSSGAFLAPQSLGISGATVGQTVKIKSVDENGVPTEWEATDMASGGGNEWELINEITTDEFVTSVTIDQDSNGNAFSLKKMIILMTLPITTNEAGEEQSNAGYAYYAVNGMRPAWQSPSNGWNNALFLWTIEALGDYYTVTCFKDGANTAELWHSDIFKSEGAFSTITKFEWRLFNGTYGWNNTNFKVYGVRA